MLAQYHVNDTEIIVGRRGVWKIMNQKLVLLGRLFQLSSHDLVVTRHDLVPFALAHAFTQVVCLFVVLSRQAVLAEVVVRNSDIKVTFSKARIEFHGSLQEWHGFRVTLFSRDFVRLSVGSQSF